MQIDLHRLVTVGEHRVYIIKLLIDEFCIAVPVSRSCCATALKDKAHMKVKAWYSSWRHVIHK